MEELKISDMLKTQYELWERHKDVWAPMVPEDARNSLLWMIGELGEVVSLIKKQGEKNIQNNRELKEEFLEELVDVFMFFLDVLNRYGISGPEFSEAYKKKSEKNKTRDFAKEHSEYKLPQPRAEAIKR